MFNSTNSRIIIAIILAILIVVFIFTGYGCAPVDSEGNPIHTAASTEDTSHYKIIFGDEVIEGTCYKLT